MILFLSDNERIVIGNYSAELILVSGTYLSTKYNGENCNFILEYSGILW